MSPGSPASPGVLLELGNESEVWEESKGPRSAVETTNRNQSLQMGHSSFDAEIS